MIIVHANLIIAVAGYKYHTASHDNVPTACYTVLHDSFIFYILFVGLCVILSYCLACSSSIDLTTPTLYSICTLCAYHWNETSGMERNPI